jgi:hypothetical protein
MSKSKRKLNLLQKPRRKVVKRYKDVPTQKNKLNLCLALVCPEGNSSQLIDLCNKNKMSSVFLL